MKKYNDLIIEFKKSIDTIKVGEVTLNKYIPFFREFKELCDNGKKFKLKELEAVYSVSHSIVHMAFILEYFTNKGNTNKPKYVCNVEMMTPLKVRNILKLKNFYTVIKKRERARRAIEQLNDIHQKHTDESSKSPVQKPNKIDVQEPKSTDCIMLIGVTDGSAKLKKVHTSNADYAMGKYINSLSATEKSKLTLDKIKCTKLSDIETI